MAATVPIMQEAFSARYHELDPQNRVRTAVILSWLQEVAAAHALQLGVAVKDLRSLGLTWVLSRLTLQLEREVRGTQQTIIRTWPATRDGLFSIRDFELADAAGNPVGQATTSWAVLDLASRRPVRLNDHLPPYPLHPVRALNDPFETLPVLELPESHLEIPVLKSDLDLNNHVNNTIYAGWALEALPRNLTDRSALVRLEISFRSEAFYGDTIRSCVGSDPHTCGQYLHRIDHAATGRELCRLRTAWKAVP